MGDLSVGVAGEHLHLLPERAAFWEERATLIVADTHFGKAATFRAAGLPVPGGTTAEALVRLSSALRRTGAGRIIFLGDFLHAPEGRVPGTLRALATWREEWHDVTMTLVRGNHDRRAGDPPADLDIATLPPPIAERPFTFAHHPRPTAEGYLLSGHLHPAVRLTGRGRQRERLPCFWFRPHLAVLPAFGDFTGNAIVLPEPGDRLFVVADHDVLEVGG
jgi:uncharacterized protein